jgi:DNA replication protein DnaC
VSNIHHLERSLRKLRLTRVGAEWHALEKRALAEGWTPSRYLLTLCNEELLWRESEKLRRYKKEARLPVAKTLGEYDFAQVPELNAAQFRRHCCKVSDEAAFCLIQRPYISKTLLTRRISPRGSP